MRRILIILAALCLALGLAACGETATEGGDASGGDATVAPVPAETAADESAADESAADASGSDGWVEVATLEGDTNKTSPSFKLEGGEQKLTYSIDGGDYATAGVFVEEKGWDMAKDGGFPVVWPDKAGSDSTRMNKDAGEYIIHVESANCDWTVTVEEKR